MVLSLIRPSDGKQLSGLVMVPHKIDRFVRLPGGEIRFLAIERLVVLYLDRPFPGFNVTGQGLFRVIRDSEMEIDEEAEDLVRTFETALKRCRRGHVIRMNIEAGMPEPLRVDEHTSELQSLMRLP